MPRHYEHCACETCEQEREAIDRQAFERYQGRRGPRTPLDYTKAPEVKRTPTPPNAIKRNG